MMKFVLESTINQNFGFTIYMKTYVGSLPLIQW